MGIGIRARGHLNLLFLFLLTFSLRVNASENTDHFDQGPSVTVIEENDLFIKTDRHYTQGLKFGYLSADNDAPAWATNLVNKVGAWAYTPAAVRVGYEVGQNIYTPQDISRATPDPTDRPYAGWLYLGMALQRRGLTSSGRVSMESFQVDLGIIGPASLAYDAQTWVHQLRGFGLPQGWSHQLKTEPGLALRYERFWLYRLGGDGTFGLDAIPDAGLSLGNTLTAAQIGATFRFGYNLPDNFGIQNVDSFSMTSGGVSKSRKHHFGAYVFGGFEGRAVAYDTFLDGNLFYAGPHVNRLPLVADLKSGFAITFKYGEVGYTYVMRTREYTAQKETDGFGSVYLRFQWPEH